MTAIVAYRDGRVYCICTMSLDGPATGGRRTSLAVVAYRDGQLYEGEEGEGEGECDRGKSYNHHTDGGEKALKNREKYAQMEIVVRIFRVNSSILSSKCWFSHGFISNILVSKGPGGP